MKRLFTSYGAHIELKRKDWVRVAAAACVRCCSRRFLPPAHGLQRWHFTITRVSMDSVRSPLMLILGENRGKILQDTWWWHQDGGSAFPSVWSLGSITNRWLGKVSPRSRRPDRRKSSLSDCVPVPTCTSHRKWKWKELAVGRKLFGFEKPDNWIQETGVYRPFSRNNVVVLTGW